MAISYAFWRLLCFPGPRPELKIRTGPIPSVPAPVPPDNTVLKQMPPSITQFARKGLRLAHRFHQFERAPLLNHNISA